MTGEVNPATLTEETLKTKGQRHINLMWESTQAFLAITVTVAVIYAEIHSIESKALNSALIMILAMYFQRTNHTKIGGVGGTDTR